MTCDKIFVFVRHAHRNTDARWKDNGLSKKGRKQASRLRRWWRDAWTSWRRPDILSSPARRCRETVEPLARKTGADVRLDERLRERGAWETPAAFRRRRDAILKDLRRADAPLIVICSHGDWLPSAVEKLTGARVLFKKGAVACVDAGDDHPRLRELRQKP